MLTKQSLVRLLAFFLIAGPFSILWASPRHVVVEALPEYAFYRPGSPLRVAFVFQIQEDWHTFWTNPGPVQGAPASVEWKLPEGWRSEGLQFPAPQRIPIGTSFSFGYTGEVVMLDTLVPPETEESGEVTIQAKVIWQVAGPEKMTEETRCNLSFLRAGKSTVRPLRADRFRIWQGRIPRANRNVRFKLEKRFLEKTYTLSFPGSKGGSRPELFPDKQLGLDTTKPLRARFLGGTWKIEIPLEASNLPKRLEGVLDPGPTGVAPVWISLRVP